MQGLTLDLSLLELQEINIHDLQATQLTAQLITACLV